MSAAVVLVSGCVTAHIPKSTPPLEDPISINIVQGGLSGFTDLPVGFHRIPDSQLVMTGHKKKGNAAVAFLLFGVIGVLMHASAEDDQVEILVSEIEDALRLTVAPIVEQAVSSSLDDNPYADKFRLVGATNGGSKADSTGPVLDLDAALILSFDGEDTYRAHAVVKASLREAAGKAPVWRTRYFSSSGSARGLFGAEGWAAAQGDLLKAYATAEFKRLIDIVLMDVSSPYTRTDDTLLMIQARFPYMKQDLQTVGYLLEDDEEFIVVHPQLHPQFAFAGVHVLDKSMTTYRQAQPGDPVFKIVENP